MPRPPFPGIGLPKFLLDRIKTYESIPGRLSNGVSLANDKICIKDCY